MQIILEALSKLNPDNDAEWTAEGLPKVDAIKAITGISEINREMITEVAPEFTRAFATEKKHSDGGPITPTAQTPGVPDQDPSQKPPETPPLDESGASNTGPILIENIDFLQTNIADPEIMAMPPHQVFRSLELMTRALEEFTRQFNELLHRREKINAKLNELSNRSKQLSFHIQRKGAKEDKQSKLMTGIRAVIERGQQEKLRKIQNRDKFIQAGTSAKEVAQGLNINAPIDDVYSKRRGTFGSRRPAPFLNPGVKKG